MTSHPRNDGTEVAAADATTDGDTATTDDAAGGDRDGDAWPTFDQAVRDRHGVADPALATTHGIHLSRYHRRTAREGWARALDGIRLHPQVKTSVQQHLMAVIVSTPGSAAASRDTAAWLHGLREWPPDRPSVAVSHACRAHRYREVVVHRSRWLEPGDITDVQGIPTLSVPAMLLSSGRSAAFDRRARLIDVLHRGLATADEIETLLDRVGPVPGKGVLRELCTQLGPLTIESIFQDVVARELLDLGYPVERSVRTIPTADGIDLHSDVALPTFKVSIETEGDAFHRTREDRRRDRRRIAAYGGTDWVPVPVDWRDWVEERERVTGAIDAAIAAQRRRGIGTECDPPRSHAA